jgi:hypothetical protein
MVLSVILLTSCAEDFHLDFDCGGNKFIVPNKNIFGFSSFRSTVVEYSVLSGRDAAGG